VRATTIALGQVELLIARPDIVVGALVVAARNTGVAVMRHGQAEGRGIVGTEQQRDGAKGEGRYLLIQIPPAGVASVAYQRHRTPICDTRNQAASCTSHDWNS
jgi:hypothetical protein